METNRYRSYLGVRRGVPVALHPRLLGGNSSRRLTSFSVPCIRHRPGEAAICDARLALGAAHRISISVSLVQIEHKPKNGPNQRSHGTARSAPPVNRDVRTERKMTSFWWRRTKTIVMRSAISESKTPDNGTRLGNVSGCRLCFIEA